MIKKQVKTIADKLSQVNEDFTIHMYDNGFMIEVSGQGHTDDNQDTEWTAVKIIVPTVEELIPLIKEVATLPRSTD